ncbi:peptidase S8/S53 domain-containing protein [Parasitella parasitica]|nr:peptidase S8/S53 domain-containing protein [Parasitella parasitica]
MFSVIRLIVFIAIFAVYTSSLEIDFVPNTFVIEFDRPIHSFASKRHVLSKRSIFYQQLAAYNISYDVRHEYEVINAVSVAFKSAQDSSLFFEKALGVKKAWPVSTISKPAVYQTKSQDSNDNISSLFGLYNATGISRVRDELGITGKGIKVGIIDTGVDYLHPALGGCFGENCRVAYGYDFVGDEYNGDNAPNPDSDPRDTCNGHGTHVAGIIGARDATLQFTGIAPDVTFGAYRIFGCAGSSSDDVIMKAMERAYLDGMDVINLSLGDVGWPESPASLLADELALKGMIVCAAAGNEGDKGIFEVGAPSLGKHALSIASVDNTHVLSHTIRLQNNLTLGYLTANGTRFNISTARLTTLGEFLADRDGCDPLKVNAMGKVVLMNRGGCMFSQKILNAQEAGAIGVIIYNNIPGPVTPSISEGKVDIEYGGISKADGYELFHYLKRNPDYDTIEFLREDLSFPVPTAGSISDFSSWGLGPDLSLKPDISAPGGQIYSTYPVDLGSYATLSGTSMASPYVAGAVALLQESRGGNRAIGAKEVRTMLINNGHPFNILNSESLESVARQGSGLIDVYHAVTSDTSVFPEQIRLNDAEHGAENHEYTLTIKNNGRLASEYLITHMVASTAQGFKIKGTGNDAFPLKKPILLSNHEADAMVDILSPVVLVEANEELNVTVRIAPPANSASMPPSIYSGYIAISKSHEREDVKYVPYAGLTTNLSQLPVLLINSTTPHLLSQHINVFSPALLSMQLAEASPLLSVSVVNAADVSQNYGLVPGGYSRYVGRNSIDDPTDVLILSWYGNVATTPEQASLGAFSRQSRTQDVQNQELASTALNQEISQIGTKLEKGVYKLKVMALKPFGNVDNDQDYDIWYSPDIVLE